MGRRGGIASGKARRKKKKRQQEVRLFFQVFDEMEKQDPEKAKQNIEKACRKGKEAGRKPEGTMKNFFPFLLYYDIIVLEQIE